VGVTHVRELPQSQVPSIRCLVSVVWYTYLVSVVWYKYLVSVVWYKYLVSAVWYKYLVSVDWSGASVANAQYQSQMPSMKTNASMSEASMSVKLDLMTNCT
jgi:hypothetical protein